MSEVNAIFQQGDFSPGDYAFDTQTCTMVQVMERIEIWGYVTYKVFDAAKGKVYKAAADRFQKGAATNTVDENYLRYVALLAKIKNEIAGGLLTTLSNGVVPLPHQLHVLYRALRTNNVRYILADEVGLGKTIEAGMIIKELKARGLVKRVLIVCPTGLVTQWSCEMQEKFGETFRVVLPSDFDTIRRLTNRQDVYNQFDQVISPMDAIKPLEKHAGWTADKVEAYNRERIDSVIHSGWDLIIIDEAHRVAGSSGDVARYKLGRLLAQASAYLLLLTATPHNGKTEPFLRLVRLLDEQAFPNAQSVVKEQVAPYLIRSEKREAIDNNGNLLFKNRFTHLVELQWEERHSLQRELYESVSEYVSGNYNRAKRDEKVNMCLIFLMIIMQRMVTSSTAAVRQSLERRLETLQKCATCDGAISEGEMESRDTENGDEDATCATSFEVSSEIAELKSLIATAKQAEFQHPDVKVEALTDNIDALCNANPEQKIIVFTEFVGTQAYLKKILEVRGYRVVILNGGMSIDERNEAIALFKGDARIFLSTDAGGEGLNLQFANVIINYDLPWNPMKIEQRCGRVDRIGQTHDVHIYNFIISDTVENRVREVLEKKLTAILQELGVDKFSDVLDSENAECDFTGVYMNSIGHSTDIEENVKNVEKEMRLQAENAIRYRDILHEEKNLGELVGKESNFDVKHAVQKMMGYHAAWKDGALALPDLNIDLHDRRVEAIVKGNVIHDCAGNVLSVSIPDFPNEAGYFMLWDLSIGEESQEKRVVPIFVNDAFVLRPMAGHRLMDVFLDREMRLCCRVVDALSKEVYAHLREISMEFAYNTFSELKAMRDAHMEEQYGKYKYAIKLRREAAERIGIDSVRRARLRQLNKEDSDMEANHRMGDVVLPEFRLMFLARLEAK